MQQPLSRSSRKLLWIGAAGLASCGLYLLLALRYPLVASLENPRASWASQVTPTGWNATLHLLIYLGVTLLYLAVLGILARRQEASAAERRWQVGLISATWLASCAALMLAAPAGESHDIFDYLFRGRMMVEYRANPLVDVPDQLGLSAPYARYLAWRKNVDTYGPVWEASSALVSASVRQAARWLGGWVEDQPSCPKSPESCRLLIGYLTGYRLFAVVLTGLSGWLIASMLRRSQPGLAPLGLAAWLLNPMTLVATALGGHNDALMLACVLLGWWLLQRQRPLLALLALFLAAHVKLTALIWLPACGLWIVWRWGWKRALWIGLAGIASGLAISWLWYAPFGGWETLPRMLHERSLYLANSPWRILSLLLVDVWEWSGGAAHRLTLNLSSWLFGVGALLIPLWLFNFRPKRWRISRMEPAQMDGRLWQALLAVSLLYLVVGSYWFQHWYILWVCAPAALLPGSRFTRSILPWLVFGGLSANVAQDFLLASAQAVTPLWRAAMVVLITWGPAILAAGTLYLFNRTDRLPAIPGVLRHRP